METGPRLKVSSDRLSKLGIEPATPGLQGKRFIHYTTAAPPPNGESYAENSKQRHDNTYTCVSLWGAFSCCQSMFIHIHTLKKAVVRNNISVKQLRPDLGLY